MRKSERNRVAVLVIIAVLILGSVASGVVSNFFSAPSPKKTKTEEKPLEENLTSAGVIKIRHLVNNTTVFTPIGVQRIYTNGTHIFIDMNHPLANKTLIFNITLLDARRNGTPVEVAQEGDEVTVDYIGWLENGEVFDTSIEAIAKNKSIPKAEVFREHSYQPITFILGSGDLLPGFERAIVGMRVNESIEVLVPPEDGYGYYSKDLVQIIPIEEEIPKRMLLKRFIEISTRNFPESSFEKGDVIPIPGTGINATVISVNNDSIILELMLKLGDVVNTGLPFNSTVVGIYPEAIEVEHNVKPGMVVHFRNLPWNSTIVAVE